MKYELNNEMISLLKQEGLSCFKADVRDLNDIMEVYKSRKKWFEKRKIKQWFKHKKSDILNTIKKDNLFCIRKNNEIISCFELSEYDKYFHDGNKAYYIYKIVVNPDYKGIGKFIFLICKYITKKNNKQYLRLDCVRNNKKLNEIYKNYGFDYVKKDDEVYCKNLRQWDYCNKN